MKILLLSLFLSLSLVAQTQIFPHGKIPFKVEYTGVLGGNYQAGWEMKYIPTTLKYHGTPVVVQYPEYQKPFTLNYKGQRLSGVFGVKFDVGNGIEFLMYQIYLNWPNGDQSYFIAKDFSGNTVYFYESHPQYEYTLDPYVAPADGGPYIWRLELLNFGLIIGFFEDDFFPVLRSQTKQALSDALSTLNPDQF